MTKITEGVRVGHPVRILARSDDAQIRLGFLPLEPEGAYDIRLFRRSPNEADDHDAYSPTQAGLCIPKSQGREFLQAFAELIREVEGR